MNEEDFNEIQDELDENDMLLVLAPSEDVDEINFKLLEDFNKKDDAKTIYVTVSKPYSTVTNVLEEKGVDPKKMFFIDCITKTNADVPERAENCVFLRPEALTDISIAISEAVESLPEDGNRLLVFDTLSTLMLYNNAETVGKFAHSISSKIREWGIKSVMLTLAEETDEEVIGQVKQFCDKTIEID